MNPNIKPGDPEWVEHVNPWPYGNGWTKVLNPAPAISARSNMKRYVEARGVGVEDMAPTGFGVAWIDRP